MIHIYPCSILSIENIILLSKKRKLWASKVPLTGTFRAPFVKLSREGGGQKYFRIDDFDGSTFCKIPVNF